MAENDVQATVDRFYGALMSGDAQGCLQAFTEDAVIWHNYDQTEQPAAEAIAQLAGLAALNPTFEMVGRDVVGDAMIQRHVTHLALPNGATASIPAIQRITVTGGRISRIEEYMDSAQMGAAMQALQAAV